MLKLNIFIHEKISIKNLYIMFCFRSLYFTIEWKIWLFCKFFYKELVRKVVKKVADIYHNNQHMWCNLYQQHVYVYLLKSNLSVCNKILNIHQTVLTVLLLTLTFTSGTHFFSYSFELLISVDSTECIMNILKSLKLPLLIYIKMWNMFEI